MGKILKKDRERFVSGAKDIIFANNPVSFKPIGLSTEYRFEGDNTFKVSLAEEDFHTVLFTVFGRFSEFVPELDMNPHSFKHNFHTDLSVESALIHFKEWLQRALSYVGRKND
jgi:hypothetical protein